LDDITHHLDPLRTAGISTPYFLEDFQLTSYFVFKHFTSLDQLTHLTAAANSATLLDMGYGYGTYNDGRVRSRSDSVQPEHSAAYTFDAQTSEWTLQSGFDAADLLARTSITLVSVEPQAIRESEQRIAGCDRCREEHAEIPFDWILADVLGKHGPYEFILTEPGLCPNCKSALTEKTLIETQGGIEIEVR